jgi:tetratricopeptide (TPR) repeat protein
MLRAALDFRVRLLSSHPERADFQQDLAESRYQLATLLARLPHRQPEDEQVYQAAIKAQTALATSASSSLDSRRKLVRYLNNLGLLLTDAGRLEEAETHYRSAIKILEESLAREPTAPGNRWHLARSEANLGVLLQKTGRLSDAEDCLRHALARQKQLATDFPRVPDYGQELGSIFNNLGLLLAATHRDGPAEEAFKESLSLRERLSREVAGVPGYLQKLAVTRLNLALLLESKNPPAARQIYREAMDVQESLSASFPDVPEYRQALGRTQYALAGLHFKQGELAEARRLLEQAIGHHRAALEFNDRNQASRDFLRDDYGVLAVILVRLKQHREAAKAAVELPRLLPDQAIEYLRASAFLVECALLASHDETLGPAEQDRCRADYQNQALTLLRQGVQAGVLKSPAVLDLPEFQSLREHPDFPRLRADAIHATKSRPG